MTELRIYIYESEPKDIVTLTVLRSGREYEIKVELG